jgi:DNA repair protein RadC
VVTLPATESPHVALLAELIGGDGAHNVARRLLASLGSLSRVIAASPETLSRAAGEPAVGQRIAAARAAVLAGQREHITRALFDLNDSDLRQYVGGLFQGLAVEQLHAFFLDIDHRYIADERLGGGGCNRVAGSLRTLVTRAIDVGARGVVLAHNHPSGCSKPSKGDVEATRKVARSLAELDLVLADHVIVGGTTITSMRGAGML